MPKEARQKMRVYARSMRKMKTSPTMSHMTPMAQGASPPIAMVVTTERQPASESQTKRISRVREISLALLGLRVSRAVWCSSGKS